jgi:hypothetical protein
MIFTLLNIAARILDAVHRRGCFSLSFDHEKLENLSPFSQQKPQETSTEFIPININLDNVSHY